MSNIPLHKSLFKEYIRPWFFRNYAILILLALLAIFSYVNSLGNEFISDDVITVAKNPHIGQVSNFLGQPFVFVQPLLHFIVYHLAGATPSAFRLINILAHLAAVIVLFGLLLTMGVKKQVAIVAAALLAVHPIETEAVTWISGVLYVVYSLFFLLSIWMYVLSKKDKRFYIVSIIFFCLMLFSSSKSVSLPAIFFLYEYLFASGKREYKRLIPYFSLAVVFILFWFLQVGQRLTDVQTVSPYSAALAHSIYNYNLWLQIPIATTTYLWLMLWPAKLTLYHAELIGYHELYIRIVIFTLFLGTIVYSFFKNKQLFFWLSFFFISLSITLAPVGIASTVAERYVYLASVGIFVVAAYLLDKIFAKIDNQGLSFLIISAIVTALMIRTITRNIEWSTFDRFWTRTVETSPLSFQARNNMGNIYMRRGIPKKAIGEYKQALAITPGRAEVYYNLGIAYLYAGQYKESIKVFQNIAKANPKLYITHQNIADAYFQMGKFDQAFTSIQKAIHIEPKNALLHMNLGIIQVRRGQFDDAKQAFEEALALDPNNEQVKVLLSKLASGELQKEASPSSIK